MTSPRCGMDCAPCAGTLEHVPDKDFADAATLAYYHRLDQVGRPLAADTFRCTKHPTVLVTWRSEEAS